MPGQSPSQPGWYPDQNGAMRWFDGASWTDHVQPGTGAPAGGAEPTMVQPGTPEPTRPLAQQPGWPPAGPPAGPPTGPPPQGPPGGSPYGAVPQPSFPVALVVLPVLGVPADTSRRRLPVAATRGC